MELDERGLLVDQASLIEHLNETEVANQLEAGVIEHDVHAADLALLVQEELVDLLGGVLEDVALLVL